MKSMFRLGLALFLWLLSNSTVSAQQIQSVKLLTAQTGWAQIGNHLFWTNDDGTHWKDIAPPMSSKENLSGVFFLNAATGWVVLSHPNSRAEQQFRVAATGDAGATWSFSPIKLPWKRYAEDFFGGGSIFFLDQRRGWVDLDLYSSSSLGPGRLLATEDGGRTWKATPNDSGRRGDFCFFSEKDGVLAGGPQATELWVTHDASKSWQPLEMKVPPGTPSADADIPTYGKPICVDAKRGFLPVKFSGPEDGAALVLFATDDGGRTWKPDRTQSGLEDISPMIAATVTGSDLIVAAPRKATGKSLELTTIPVKGKSSNAAADVTGSALVFQLSFVSSSTGWASTNDALLSTTDGGTTWTNITPNRMPTRAPSPLSPQNKPPPAGLGLPVSPPPIGSGMAYPNTTTGKEVRLGFDTAQAPSVSKMQTWWNYSPYYGYQISLAGAANHETNANLTPNWVTQVENQGWGLWPVWVGPQAPCANNQSLVLITASSPTQAHSQGQAQATAAITALQKLGGGLSNTIIYYDMENYDTTNSACVAIVVGFLNGWINGMQSGRYKAGVYGNVAPVAQNFSQLSPLPDDVWVTLASGASTPPSVTIWSLASTQVSLCDIYSNPPCQLWSTNQRIHQYLVDRANNITYTETWGKVTVEIDADIIDADVAYSSTGTKTQTYTFTSFLPSGNADFPYSINNIGVANPNYGGFINGSQSDIPYEIGQTLVSWENWQNGGVANIGSLLYNPDTQAFSQLSGYPNTGQCGSLPNCNTFMGLMNNAGSIVGLWVDANGAQHGFLDKGGNFTSIDYPGAVLTSASGINDAGLVTGYYGDSSGSHGFLYNALTRQFVASPIDYPGISGNTYPYAINGSAEIVGVYFDGANYQGFLYKDGNFDALPVTCGSQVGTLYMQGINDNGMVIGAYQIAGQGDGVWNGFVSHKDGTNCDVISYPGSTWSSPWSINDAGQISGSWDGTGYPINAYVAVPKTP